jgi:hypothetical protein
VRKCLKAGFSKVAVIGLDEEHLQKIAGAVAQCLGPEAATRVEYFRPDQFITHLQTLQTPQKPEAPEMRRGYKIKRSVRELTAQEQKQREEAAIRSIAETMRRKAK